MIEDFEHTQFCYLKDVIEGAYCPMCYTFIPADGQVYFCKCPNRTWKIDKYIGRINENAPYRETIKLLHQE
jgi:hypothetical protein